MKCPFRIVESYTRNIGQFKGDGSGNPPAHYTQIVPCTESECDTKIQTYADCIKRECPYYATANYIGNPCMRVRNQ